MDNWHNNNNTAFHINFQVQFSSLQAIPVHFFFISALQLGQISSILFSFIGMTFWF